MTVRKSHYSEKKSQYVSGNPGGTWKLKKIFCTVLQCGVNDPGERGENRISSSW